MITINGKPIWFWVLVILCFGAVIVSACEAIRGGVDSINWLVLACVAGGILKALDKYSKGSPICPNCKNDITTCRPDFCHNCGQPLVGLRCEACAVDWNWIAKMAKSSEITGNNSEITYCPGCGALVESEHHRSGSEPWYSRTEPMPYTETTSQVADNEQSLDNKNSSLLNKDENQAEQEIAQAEQPDEEVVRDSTWLRYAKFLSIIVVAALIVGAMFAFSVYVAAIADSMNTRHHYTPSFAEKQAAKDTAHAFWFRSKIGAFIGGGIGLIYVIRCLIRKEDP
jgi:hypothetical protein